MNKVTKTVLGIIAIVLVAWGILFLAQDDSNQTSVDQPVRIGFMTDLSGPAAPYGTEIEKGARMAVNEIDNNNLDVVFEDTRCSGSDATSIMNKFINIDNISITGGTVCSNVTLAIAPIAESNEIIHLSTGASSPDLSDAGDYIFRLWPSDDLEASVLAEYSVNDLSLDSASILYVDSEFSVALREAFAQMFETEGGEIISSESFASDATDFRTQLTKLKQDSPEGLYIISNPEQLPAIIQQTRELNIESTLLSYGPAVEAEGVMDSFPASASLYYAHPNQEDSETFAQKYEQSHGEKPGLGASVGYDTLTLLYEAVRSCGDSDTDCVRDYLYSIDNYQGASGSITIDENGDVQIPSSVKRFSQGEVEVLE